MSVVCRRLNEIIDSLINVRDNQTEIKCMEVNCICEEFDLIIDIIKDLKTKFRNFSN